MKRSRNTSDQAMAPDASEKSGGNLFPEKPASSSSASRQAYKHRNDDDDDDASFANHVRNNKEQTPATMLTPHTHRLLKLILEGTAEHAAEASVHLTTIASQSSSATQLWEILGRLQEGLTSSTWKTRSQAADALQSIARQLPLSDQLEFLQKDKPKGKTTLARQEMHHYLTIQDLSVGGLDKVLSEGRLLMATSNDRYDVMKERELRDLDRSVLRNRIDGTGRKDDFVERRMKLQRHILAQRLGLAGIRDVLGEQNVLPKAITLEDMADTVEEDEPPEAKRLRHAKRAKHQDSLSQKKMSLSDNKLDDSFSLRALLVMEMEEQQRKARGSVSSHRNPQELLATELVYRMFDPAWHVRHGALLGTLSLLRAWKTYANQNDDLFGKWPQDVLARSLCILALDRFGDFSGALATATTSNVTGSVIAPVREVSGQLISVLFVMASESEQFATLELLFRLLEYSSEWEPRHGALAALKYILVVLKTKSMSKEGGSGIDYIKKMIDRIVQTSIRCLCDSSDDVNGTAAQVATEYLHSCNSIEPFMLKCSPNILQSIKTARSFSSCMVDLVQLLAEMLRIDARAFVTSLSLSEDFVSNMKDISEVFLSLLDSDYESVQSSALRSIMAFCNLLCSGSVMDENDAHDNFYVEAARTCRHFAEKIFEWFFCWCEDGEPRNDEVTALLALRDEVWNDLMLVVQSWYLRAVDEMRELESNLLRRYFWVEDILRSTSEDTPIYPQASSALASFLIATKCTLSTSCQVSLMCMLASPWVYHCEASCLLFGSLCARKVALSGMEDIRLSLASLLQESPLCLVVRDAQNFASITRDKTFYDLCEQVFWAELSRSVAPTTTVPPISCVSKKITGVWKTALETRGLTRSEGSKKLTSFCGMRIEACIGSAIVVSGLPAKVTPVVRSLMTSLKNESNPSRQALTCTSLVLLVKELGNKPAQRKILDKICSIANGEDGSDSSNEALQDIARKILCSITRDISCGDELKAIEPFWSRISVLFSCTENDPALGSPTRFLRIFTHGLREGTELVGFLIDHFTEALVRLFSIVDASVRGDISASLSHLCTVNSDHLFVRILPSLLQLLENQSNDQVRLSSCSLLKELVEVSGMAASHFVRFLLPVVMKLMTDRDERCSKIANALFADLVRVAPLAQGTSTMSLKLTGTYSKCESVIDHLIFGQPLPPCEIPCAISEDLKKGGIKLREYQMEGVSFLRFLHSVRLNGAICDSMGLGKTLQALVAIAISHISLQNSKSDDLDCPSPPVSLVVCPASVVGHWIREINKYFPGVDVFRSLCYLGSASDRKALRSDILSQHNIIVTSYSVLRSDIEFLAAFEWTCCILDEGHLLKNPQTATARASKRLKSTHRIILTGTPVQNKVSEIWAMFDFLLPNFLGTWKSFSKEYARPIMRSQQPGASAALIQEGMTKLKLLHQQVLPFILRREKEQVLKELPPKNIIIVRVALSDLQQIVYQDFCTKTETKKTLEALGNGLSDALMSGGSVNAEVLKSILFLRLLCTHPSLVLPKTKERGTQDGSWFSLNSSGKLVALAQLLAEAGIFDDPITAADNDESLLYCDDDTRSSDAYSDVVLFQNDSILGPNTESSSTKSKCLIFSQFSASLDIVEELLFKQRMPSLRYLRLDGRVPSEKRAEVAEAFNKDPSVSVMLLTTRVGGLGLNLTGADIVIFLESDFNPFADLQAMDRAHRIGQNRTVNVYRIITENSIEEKILELQERKIATSEAIVNTDNSSIYQIGTERLLDIFSFNTTTETDKEALGDYDLDALMEKFADDYASLSVSEFTSTLK